MKRKPTKEAHRRPRSSGPRPRHSPPGPMIRSRPPAFRRSRPKNGHATPNSAVRSWSSDQFARSVSKGAREMPFLKGGTRLVRLRATRDAVVRGLDDVQRVGAPGLRPLGARYPRLRIPRRARGWIHSAPAPSADRATLLPAKTRQSICCWIVSKPSIARLACPSVGSFS